MTDVTDGPRPRPDGPSPDRVAARRPGPHGALQLGLRPPPRRHVRVPHRGHRRRPQHPGVLRRALRGDALARPRLGRGSRRRRPARAVPPERAFGDLRRRPGAAARVLAHLRLLLHQRRGRGAPQGLRLQGHGVRRLLPRARPTSRSPPSRPRVASRSSGSGCPTARSPSTTSSAARSPSTPTTCPTSRWPAPTASRSTRWSTRSTTR